MDADVTKVLTRAKDSQEIDPTGIRNATEPLLDMIEEVEALARKIERWIDDLEVRASTGDLDQDVFSRVHLLKSKAGVLLREAQNTRGPLMNLRRGVIEFRQAERQVRATLHKAGMQVPSEDLTGDDVERAPDMRRGV